MIMAILTINFRLLYSYLLNEAIELDLSLNLCKAISNHFISLNKRELNSLSGHLNANIVMLNINVLIHKMKNWIFYKNY